MDLFSKIVHWLFFAVLSVLARQHNESPHVDRITACSCRHNNLTYDLSPLAMTGHKARFTIKQPDGYLFSYNPCLPFNLTNQTGSLNPNNCTNVAICRWFYGNSQAHEPYGFQHLSQVHCVVKTKSVITLRYKQGGFGGMLGYTTDVELICNKSQTDEKGAFRWISGTTHPVFQVVHRSSCPREYPEEPIPPKPEKQLYYKDFWFWIVVGESALLIIGMIFVVIVCVRRRRQWPYVHVPDDRREPDRREPDRREPDEREPVEREPDEREPDRRELDRREPDRREPDRREPDRREPDEREPDEREPDRREPDRREPDRREPDRREPDRREPDRREPDRREPDRREHDEREPDRREPDRREPDRREPDEREPDRREPDRREPDRREPDRREPDRREPDRREPDRREHDEREPDRRMPDRREPDRREPDRREPDRREPDRREPDRREPDERDPDHGNLIRVHAIANILNQDERQPENQRESDSFNDSRPRNEPVERVASDRDEYSIGDNLRRYRSQ